MKKYVKLYEEFTNPTHSGLITDPAQAKQWLEENLVGKKDQQRDLRIKEGTYRVDSNGVVDVDGSVYIHEMGLEYIPIQFGKVTGSFWCSDNHLTSLEGSPNHVVWDFYCINNHLTSLEGAPSEVGSNFYCHNNFLCIENGLYKINNDNPCYDTEDLELIAQRFQEKVKNHPDKEQICKSVLNRPDLVEMFIRYNVTEVTMYLSDDVKDISSTAMKVNHKLR